MKINITLAKQLLFGFQDLTDAANLRISTALTRAESHSYTRTLKWLIKATLLGDRNEKGLHCRR